MGHTLDQFNFHILLENKIYYAQHPLSNYSQFNELRIGEKNIK